MPGSVEEFAEGSSIKSSHRDIMMRRGGPPSTAPLAFSRMERPPLPPSLGGMPRFHAVGGGAGPVVERGCCFGCPGGLEIFLPLAIIDLEFQPVHAKNTSCAPDAKSTLPRRNSMSTCHKFITSTLIVVLAGGLAVIRSLSDVGTLIRQDYPSASVVIHHGHSPGIRPVLDIMRMVRGKDFIPKSEWVTVQIASEAEPVVIATLLQYRVSGIALTNCKVNDLGPLFRKKPQTFALFTDCDLSSVPADQKAMLMVSVTRKNTLFHGSP